MSSAQAAIEAIRKTITVNCSVEHAFRTFTEGIGSWWPLPTHSVGGAQSESVMFEPGAEGRLVERMSDGQESVWGYVRAWEPPHRIVFSWHPGEDCARTQVHEATEIEVRFSAEGDGTRVDLEHRGWERLADRGVEARESYDSGWDTVLGKYVQAMSAGL